MLMQSSLQRDGIRQLPGICWYPAKRTAQTVKQGGTTDIVYSPLTDVIVCQGLLYMGGKTNVDDPSMVRLKMKPSNKRLINGGK